MAERRMFTKKIIDSDAFLDMPLSTQALYFHLNMRADDDGFLNNPKKIQRMIGASEDDLKVLIAKRFVISFETGVVVIKHWRMHNLLRKDRYNPTQYIEEKERLFVKDNGSYTEKVIEITPENQLATTWQPTGNHVATQVSIGKVRIGKESIVECSVVEELKEEPEPEPQTSTHTPSANDIYDELVNKYGKIFVDERVERAKQYKNISIEKIAQWCEEDFKKQPVGKKNTFNSFPQRQYDMAAMERMMFKAQNPPPTAGTDEGIKQRVEVLKKELGVS